jgi:hypothetical protein
MPYLRVKILNGQEFLPRPTQKCSIIEPGDVVPGSALLETEPAEIDPTDVETYMAS